MKRSESLAELAKALSKAQGEMKAAVRSEENPFYKSRYADLQSIWEVIREPFARNGLCVIQTSFTEDGRPGIETTLLHISGEFVSEILILKPVREKKGEGFIPAEDPQAIGSALSYARRYGVASISGVVTGDDDGNAASGIEAKKESSQDSREQKGEQKHEVTEGQKTYIETLFKKHKFESAVDKAAYASNVLKRTVETIQDPKFPIKITGAEASALIQNLKAQ